MNAATLQEQASGIDFLVPESLDLVEAFRPRLKFTVSMSKIWSRAALIVKET